jgi:hypothetical protein
MYVKDVRMEDCMKQRRIMYLKLACLLGIFLFLIAYLPQGSMVSHASSVKKVTLNKTKVSIYKGNTVQLKAEVSPKNATVKLTWKSSNSSVAKVSQKGVVTGVKKGTATITVRNSNGKSAKCSVTVNNTVELSKYLGNSTVNKVAKAIGGMKVKATSKYKSYCSRTNISIGILAKGGYDHLTDISNTGYKGVTLYGIRIGDTYNTVQQKLQKNGIYCSSGNKNIFYGGDAVEIVVKFKSGKLSSYTWKLRYTS